MNPNSYTTRGQKAGPIKGQIIRILRRSKYLEDFKKDTNQLFGCLRNQGYNRSLLRNIRSNAVEEANPRITDGVVGIGFHPCGICFLCTGFSMKGTQITKINDVSVLNGNFSTCNTDNVVYYIKCVSCDKVYVGETKFSLQKRISQHLASIRLRYDTAVANHFDSSHNIQNDLRCGVLKHNNGWSDMMRKEKEGELIKRLGTIEPDGINISRGVQTKRIVLPFIEADLMRDKWNVPENIKIVYKNENNLKKKMLIGSKKKLLIREIKNTCFIISERFCNYALGVEFSLLAK